MINKILREELIGRIDEEDEDSTFVFFESPSFDNSIIGYTEDHRLIYSYDLMVDELTQEYIEDGTDPDEAIVDAEEWIQYNTIRSLYYEKRGPIICYTDALSNLPI